MTTVKEITPSTGIDTMSDGTTPMQYVQTPLTAFALGAVWEAMQYAASEFDGQLVELSVAEPAQREVAERAVALILDRISGKPPTEPVRRAPFTLDEFHARLDKLRTLTAGWYDGDGREPCVDTYQLGVTVLLAMHAEGCPLPHLYPCEDGGLSAEWDLNPSGRATLEFSPDEVSGYSTVSVDDPASVQFETDSKDSALVRAVARFWLQAVGLMPSIATN